MLAEPFGGVRRCSGATASSIPLPVPPVNSSLDERSPVNGLTAVVVAGGPAPDPPVQRGDLGEVGFVVAADSGYSHAQAIGLTVDLLVGDLDSISPQDRAHAESAGVRVDAHPPAKDQTDLELALAAAAAIDPDAIVVLGSTGGRFDHTVANLLVLADESLHHIAVSGRFDSDVVTVIPPAGKRVLHGEAGQTFSLMPVGGPATGVSVEGARWNLEDAVLHPTRARGLSNEFQQNQVEIVTASGILVALQRPFNTPYYPPGSEGDHQPGDQ